MEMAGKQFILRVFIDYIVALHLVGARNAYHTYIHLFFSFFPELFVFENSQSALYKFGYIFEFFTTSLKMFPSI